MFKIGDTVAVLDDVIKGIITSIENHTISVKSNDGMIYRFQKSELVKIEKEQSELSKYIDINNKLLRDKLKSTPKKKPLFKKAKKEIIMEVDLHIEKLVKSTRNMDNFDILTKQIDTAKAKIEYCIKKRIPKLILIHGVGEGVLKTELQNLLAKYPVNYYDASYQKYGLGATEIKIC